MSGVHASWKHTEKHLQTDKTHFRYRTPSQPSKNSTVWTINTIVHQKSILKYRSLVFLGGKQGEFSHFGNSCNFSARSLIFKKLDWVLAACTSIFVTSQWHRLYLLFMLLNIPFFLFLFFLPYCIDVCGNDIETYF